MHYCDITGRELEALFSIPCRKCPHIKRCEDDHTIIIHEKKA